VQIRSTIAQLVPTLAYELAISVPATRPLIQEALKTDRSIPQKALGYQFKKLLVDPILKVRNATALTPTVIIIDALDECGEIELVVELIEIITNACLKIRPFPFRVFLTSRVEEHIRKKLEASAARSIIYPLDLRNFDASDDIRELFRSRFSTIHDENRDAMGDILRPWPQNADVEALLEKADGSFSRASEFINFINDQTDAPHRKLAVLLEAHSDSRRRRSSGLLKMIKRSSRSSSQTSTSESSHFVSSPTTPVGGNRFGFKLARTVRLRVHTSDILPHTPESTVLNESPVSQDDGSSIEATTLEGLIDDLIQPRARTSLYFYPSYY
jgi:hypothetical protein